jgi:Ca-activated chloride channel homolog
MGGDVGSGHTVTALYEVIPLRAATPALHLKYQQPPRPRKAAKGELLTVSVRYKKPMGSRSSLISLPVVDQQTPREPSAEFHFAASVAAFGMLLRGSPYIGQATFDSVLESAMACKGRDSQGYRAEFIELVKLARIVRSLD